ncbi:MAG TPA: SGNH/GDSL hydrolase family protein [Micromonosporaceae bacterium]
MPTVRRTVRTLGYGLVFATGGATGLLAAELLAARLRRHVRPAIGPGIRASIGEPDLATVRMVMVGDSFAAGVGVTSVDDSVGGHLATLLAGDGHRIELSSVAVPGTRSHHLDTQVSRALLGRPPDVAVILVGLNDATPLVNPSEAAFHLGAAVRRLLDAGVAVVVGTCPDLAASRAIGPPLRQIVGWLGRRIARTQEPAVVEAGGVAVDLARRTGPVFRADPGTICVDGFHPSADGYRVWAHALYPAVRDAIRSVRSG